MGMFNRMAHSFFPPKGEPSRPPRNLWTDPEQLAKADKIQPSIDEDTALNAKEILTSIALERCFDRLRGSAMQDITTSAPGMSGLQAREDGHAKIRALDSIKAELEAMADQLKIYERRRVSHED